MATTPVKTALTGVSVTEGGFRAALDNLIDWLLAKVYITENNLQVQTYTAFTTAGSNTAYTLTPSPALATLSTNHRFNVIFNATAGATPTLEISGLTPKLLKVYDGTGAKKPAGPTTIVGNFNSDVIFDGVDYVVLTPVVPVVPVVPVTSKIQPILATVASNALTITLNPTTLDFRSTTLGSGTVTTVSNAAAISTVISSGSTAGSTSAVKSMIVVLAINNAGTMELAWTNIAGGTNLDETGLITTVAEGGAGAADSATIIYSTTARTSVAYRVVGYVDSTQATAGTWATAPSTIQGAGGQSLQHVGAILNGTAVATTSGTAHDFTGIPSWAKRITVEIIGNSTNGISIPIIQLGISTGVETAGYTGNGFTSSGASVANNATQASGFNIEYGGIAAVDTRNAIYTLTLQSGNTWVSSLVSSGLNAARNSFSISTKTLAGTLDRIRLTTVNGTDTFDAGSLNILFE